MVKVKDIAKECNVSVATVSKALHNSKELSKETITYICETAKRMGYIPNANARSLKVKKTYSIGILFVDYTISGLRHEYFSTILDSLKVEAEKRGYDITFITSNLTNHSMSYLEHARYRNLDGVVIASVNFHDPEVIELVNSEIPTVTIDYVYNGSTAILSNNSEGMEDLVNYVYSKGHRKIALIYGDPTDVTNKRMAGYYTACKKLGLEINPDYVVAGKYHDPKSSGRATKNLLKLKELPTCIIYPDDISILGGLTALQQENISVPNDISVVGYDGIALSRYLRPILTTYVQASTELGRLAAEKLIERIESPQTFIPEILIVKGEIQKGETVKDISK